MKTEDIDKRIGMPDVNAEWAKFEREVMGKEAASNKSILMWGFSIAASIALVAGIFFFWNHNNSQTDKMLTRTQPVESSNPYKEPPTISEIEITSETEIASNTEAVSNTEVVADTETALETKTVTEMEQRPAAELLAMASPSNTEEIMVPNSNQTVNVNVFDVVEQNPLFPGGNKALQEFVKTNQRYPDLAMEYGAKGRVIMNFWVDSVGQVSDIKVFRYMQMTYDTLRLGLETDEKQEQVKEQIALQLGEESKRILSLLPRWSPGKIRGKTVRMRYTMPVLFQYSEAERQSFLAQKQDANSSEALQHSIAGMTNVPTSGDLASDTNLVLTDIMRVMGRNRNGNDSILILVNGTPLPDSLGNSINAFSRLPVYLYKQGLFIDSVMVYKDEQAKKRFGNRAKNGVVALTTTPDTLCNAYVSKHPELMQVRHFVEGYVLNEDDEPIGDAWVGITPIVGAATDSTGHFALWLPLKDHELLATCTGYDRSRKQIGQTDTTLTFRLRRLTKLNDVKVRVRQKGEKAIPIKEIR